MSDYDYFYSEDGRYCYPGSNVLRNKLDIHDEDILKTAESRITIVRMLELDDDPVRGCFDLDHLRGIHRRIFGDIYEWAGEIRTVDISKGNMFCRCEYIVEQSAKLFKELKDEGCLKGLERDELIDRLAYYLGEINAIHPFREGNGRTQRKFIEQLSEEAGFPLNFDGTSDRVMIEASAFAFIGDYERMREIIRRSIS